MFESVVYFFFFFILFQYFFHHSDWNIAFGCESRVLGICSFFHALNSVGFCFTTFDITIIRYAIMSALRLRFDCLCACVYVNFCFVLVVVGVDGALVFEFVSFLSFCVSFLSNTTNGLLYFAKKNHRTN